MGPFWREYVVQVFGSDRSALSRQPARQHYFPLVPAPIRIVMLFVNGGSCMRASPPSEFRQTGGACCVIEEDRFGRACIISSVQSARDIPLTFLLVSVQFICAEVP